MRIMKKLLYVFIIVSLLASAAHASFISLNTTVTSEVRGNILNVSVSVVNKGDEAAHNVQAEVRLGDKKILANKKQELGVGGIYRAKTSFQLNQKPISSKNEFLNMLLLRKKRQQIPSILVLIFNTCM